MSPGGGVSVPAGAAAAGDDAAVAGAAAEDDVACDAGVLPEPLLQALAQSPAAARTTSRLVIVLALPMAGCYEYADQRRRCAR
jgi:hypothetical protein